jgi:hypothetical protein
MHSTSSLGRRHKADHHQRLETSKSSSAAPPTTSSISSSPTPASTSKINTWPLKLRPEEEKKSKLKGIKLNFYIIEIF